jgi:hypothetical protein
LLDENDCLVCGAALSQTVTLGGAHPCSFPVYAVRVEIPALGFNRYIRSVGVRRVPAGLGGLACYRFLNRFTYGNFGDPRRFGLEI